MCWHKPRAESHCVSIASRGRLFFFYERAVAIGPGFGERFTQDFEIGVYVYLARIRVWDDLHGE